MDNSLRYGYGKDLCRQLKDDPLTKHYPVILFSANPDIEKIAADSNADAHLKKPFDINVLLALVTRFS